MKSRQFIIEQIAVFIRHLQEAQSLLNGSVWNGLNFESLLTTVEKLYSHLSHARSVLVHPTDAAFKPKLSAEAFSGIASDVAINLWVENAHIVMSVQGHSQQLRVETIAPALTASFGLIQRAIHQLCNSILPRKECVIDPVHKLLVSNIEGKFYATANTCSHYKAPLIKGSLSSDGKVICPWHGACFNVKTGDIEDGPGLKKLTTYPLEEEGGRIYLMDSAAILKDKFEPGCRVESIKLNALKDDNGILIVGGGAAGASAAEAARKAGYGGRIVVLSAESYLPIDRIKLSKIFGPTPDSVKLYDQQYLSDLKVEFKLNSQVTNVDFGNKHVTLSNGERYPYNRLILASGGNPRKLSLPGATLENIFSLRSLDDSTRIKKALPQDEPLNIVIIGSGFIGMEVASTLLANNDDHRITIVTRDNVPFELQFGRKIGEVFARLASQITFENKHGIVQFEPNPSDPKRVGGVRLSNGQLLPSDMVVVAVGITPETSYVQDRQLLLSDQSILVNEYMQVQGIPSNDVYAAGDIATFPADFASQPIRIEHWNVAIDQGRVAGNNAAIETEQDLIKFKSVPFFWTMQYGKSLRFVGSTKDNFDDIYIRGTPESFVFEAFFHKNGRIVAVATMGMDPVAAHASLLFASKRMPDLDYLKSDGSLLSIKP